MAIREGARPILDRVTRPSDQLSPKKRPAAKQTAGPSKISSTKERKETKIVSDLDDPALPKRLEKLASESGYLVAGSMHLIKLDSIRNHYGERWANVCDRVYQTLKSVVEQRITDEDLCIRYKDVGYMIIFAQVDEDTARTRCALIAEELSSKLFGESNTPEQIQISTAVFRPEENPIFSSITPVKIADHVANGDVAQRPQKKIAPETSQSLTATPGKSTTAVTKTPKRTSISDNNKAETGINGPVRFAYRPIWLVKNEMISAHVCIPTTITKKGILLTGEEALADLPQGKRGAEYDPLALRKVLDDLRPLEKVHRKVAIVLPLHFETFTSPTTRAASLKILKSIPQSVRGQLLIELMNIPDDAVQSDFAAVMSCLGSLCRAVMVRLNLNYRDVEQLENLGFYALGVDLSEALIPENKIVKKMAEFNEASNTRGFRTFAHGVRSISMLSAALAAGFSYIDGSPIMTIVENPGENAPFSFADIYAPLIDTKP